MAFSLVILSAFIANKFSSLLESLLCSILAVTSNVSLSLRVGKKTRHPSGTNGNDDENLPPPRKQAGKAIDGNNQASNSTE